MLQEMAAKNSAFWSALKTPLHGWPFSSIFPQTYLACQCPVMCSACPWTICSANRISMCYSKVWSAVSYSLKVSRRHCRRQEGLAQSGSLLQLLGNAPGFPSGRSRGRAQSCCGHTVYSSTANCSSLSSPPQRGFLGWPRSRVRSAVPLLGHVVTTKLSVTCKKQLGKEKRKNSFVSLGREGVGRGWRLDITGLLRHGHRGAQRFLALPCPAVSELPQCLLVPSQDWDVTCCSFSFGLRTFWGACGT